MMLLRDFSEVRIAQRIYTIQGEILRVVNITDNIVQLKFLTGDKSIITFDRDCTSKCYENDRIYYLHTNPYF